MSQRCSRLIFAVVSGLFALGGCSSHRQLAMQAVSFNLTVEKAQNEMLLLNVIRAKDRLPMYMTGISSLTGNVQTTLSTGMGASYTRSKGIGLDTITRSVTPSAGATLSTNPTFSLAVLDTQEFMRGFLSPVGMETLDYYWGQGWPRSLLLYLLVQRVEIESTSGAPQVWENYPESEDPELRKVKRFGCWLSRFLARNPRIETVTVTENVGPQLSKDEVSDVAKLVQIAKEGLILSQVGNQDVYQLQRLRTATRFALGPKPSQPGSPNRSSDCADAGASSGPPETPAADASRQGKPDEQVMAAGQIRVKTTGSGALTLFLRSPEGVIYYLGELMRSANRKDSPKIPYFCLQSHLQPLFVALPTGLCKETLLEADAGRGGFSVPAGQGGAQAPCEEGEIWLEDATKCEPGRSMQSLRLLSQLMSLQKSAKDLPSTAVVRVIN